MCQVTNGPLCACTRDVQSSMPTQWGSSIVDQAQGRPEAQKETSSLPTEIKLMYYDQERKGDSRKIEEIDAWRFGSQKEHKPDGQLCRKKCAEHRIVCTDILRSCNPRKVDTARNKSFLEKFLSNFSQLFYSIFDYLDQDMSIEVNGLSNGRYRAAFKFKCKISHSGRRIMLFFGLREIMLLNNELC